MSRFVMCECVFLAFLIRLQFPAMHRARRNNGWPDHLHLAWLMAFWPIACAGPAPKLFPPSPTTVRSLADGGIARDYDTNGDGRPDFAEDLSSDGRVVQLRYHLNDAQSSDRNTVLLNKILSKDCRHLVLILDSIPYSMVRDLWNQGRFRLFHPPVRVISPFPVMTDPCLAEFFGVSPCLGIESEYYDGRGLTNGYFTYANEKNTPWLRFVDYHLNPIAHSVAYPSPHEWFDHELGRIQSLFNQRNHQDCFVGYCVGPSALGAKYGRMGHQVGLVRLDRFCQSVMHAARGRIQITLMSDHGHNLVRSRRIDLPRFLKNCGYRVTDELNKSGDVVVPEFGVVTCAVAHTHEPAAVARDLAGAEGIELVAYREHDGAESREQIVVLNQNGRATITRRGEGYHYSVLRGDPLKLKPILNSLRQNIDGDADGFIEDRALFDVTSGHEYPDVIHRLWRAFHGLVENTPDVFISMKDGWHCGSALMSEILDLAAAHGNLNALSSTAFAMTTAGSLEPVLRMENLRDALVELGVPLASENQTVK